LWAYRPPPGRRLPDRQKPAHLSTSQLTTETTSGALFSASQIIQLLQQQFQSEQECRLTKYRRIHALSLCLFALLPQLALGQSPAALPAERLPAAGEGLVTLAGHVPAVALRKEFDRGEVDANLPFDHMQLLLRRAPERQAALNAAIAALEDPHSPSFHQWMTAAEFGEKFGASDAEIAVVADWLRSHGIAVEGADQARTVIEFSATAGQLEEAFHTRIHNLNVNGHAHVSAVVEPSVPASIAALVAGVPMSDFQPHPMHHDGRSLRFNPESGKFAPTGEAGAQADPSFIVDYQGSTFQMVAPGDFAKIYNLNTVWSQGYRGKGQTIAVVEDSIMKVADVATFRKAFGLSNYAGTFIQEMPAGAHPCGNPGYLDGPEGEAALDAEWAGATAPDAAIVLAACANTRTQFGGLTAVENLLSQKTPPQIISMSYGSCEEEMGAITLGQFAGAYEQAVAEGVSVFVSTGDEGPASCDAGYSFATNGITSSGFDTTPYNVAVGGTDFYDYIQGTGSEYWATTNTIHYSTAFSYVPEKTWNDSCADSDLLAYAAYSTPYGVDGFCNNYPGYQFVTTTSGSGGPSAVYLKPSWQNVYGVPADGLRDVPDVSLFASNGFWGHALVYCNSDLHTHGAEPCTYTNANDTVVNSGGGTSYATPAMAGIFALITQKYGRQGNPNPGLYALAANEYGTQSSPDTARLAACDATLGKASSSTCTFHDVTKGSIDLPCIGANCFGWGVDSFGNEFLGALSVSTASFEPAYPATQGWDYATGLGSVNAANLLANWGTVASAAAKAK
jgi:subtilase family serine protease